jgi:hypothetical protein
VTAVCLATGGECARGNRRGHRTQGRERQHPRSKK